MHLLAVMPRRCNENPVTGQTGKREELQSTDLALRSRGVRTVIRTDVATNGAWRRPPARSFLKDYDVVFTSDGTETYS